MLENLSLVVSSFDAYEDLWKPFFTLLKENWPESEQIPIYLGTNSKKYIHPGLQIYSPLADIPEDYSSWSKCVIEILKRVKTDYVLFMLDDFFLWKQVDNGRLEKVLSYMKSNKRIGYICLKQDITPASGPKWHQNAMNCEYPELHFRRRGYPYRVSTQTGLWRKDYLLKLLRAHETAWQFEVRANIRANFYCQKQYGVRESLFIYPGGGYVWKGKVLNEYANSFPEELVGDIKKKRGFITKEEWNRPKKRKRTIKDVWSLLLSFYPRFW